MMADHRHRDEFTPTSSSPLKEVAVCKSVKAKPLLVM
jgi:hypothetical protein